MEECPRVFNLHQLLRLSRPRPMASKRLWQAKPNQQRNQLHQVLRPRLHEAMISHYAVIRVYDDAGNVIQTHEQAGDFKHWWGSTLYRAPFFLACLADLRSSFWQSRFS